MARAQTTKQYLSKLKKRIKELTSDNFLKPCILFNHTAQSDRIFSKGNTASGGAIGRYSAGYLKLRKKKKISTGVAASKVILQFSGELRRDYESSLTRAREGVWQVGVKRGFNADKLTTVIKKYGKDVFKLSKSERKALNLCLTKKRLKLGV